MKHIHHILYCLLIIAGLSSCITDIAYDNSCPDGGESDADKAQVMLSLSVPNSQFPSATRSISDDSNINSLYVLVFEGEKGTDTKDYKLTAIIDIKDKYLNAKDSQFYVAIKETPKAVCLSLVANTEIASSFLGTTKGEILKSLTFEDASSLSEMPMYGEAEPFPNGLSRDVHYNDASVSLIRALAQIEVQNNSTQSEDDFKLLDIEILNTNVKGYVAAGQNVVEQETDEKSIKIEANGQKTLSAYVAETKNNSPHKISVLIHAKYKDRFCYYRLDMIINNENDEITKLVRNYRYLFSLQNVNYPGDNTREAALEGDPDNAEFDTRVMTLTAEESDILDITTDDYYFLGVNTSTLQLEINADSYFAKLKILTNNNLEGWEIIDAPDYVKFTPGTTGGIIGKNEVRKVQTVWVSTDKTLAKDFNFYITSGKIRKTITVRLPIK